jgi:hypothetical protein
MSLDYRPMLLSHQLFRETVPLMVRFDFLLFSNNIPLLTIFAKPEPHHIGLRNSLTKKLIKLGHGMVGSDKVRGGTGYFVF